jgi:MFS family permease
LEIAAGLFGLSIAANYSLVSAILVELISLERFVNAYGLLLLFQGVANLIGPPLAGWISDLTGKINWDEDVSLIIKQLYLKKHISFGLQARTIYHFTLPVFLSFSRELF